MKKKVLVFSHALEIGGAERALLGLLESFDYTRYDVDLFLMRHEGELFQNIPEHVNLLPPIKEYTGLATPMTSLIKKRLYNIAYGRMKAKLKARSFIKSHQITGDNAIELEYSHKYTEKYMPKINDKEYDLAISFLTPHYFVAEKVNAKKKIAWIHTDYSYIKIDTESECEMWGKYDYIAAISDDAATKFCRVFPTLSKNIFTIENIIPMRTLHLSAQELINDMTPLKDGYVLLSIGRFCNAKNFENIPEICKRLLNKGLNIRWYIIGFGATESLIKDKIIEFNLEDRVIVLGKKENPYPYINTCDIYIQPSRYEGKCVSVVEAQLLQKPVVITNYPTSSSQLIDGFDGVIVPMDNESCAEGIARVIRDRELQQRLIENTKNTDYSNKEEINKLYHLID